MWICLGCRCENDDDKATCYYCKLPKGRRAQPEVLDSPPEPDESHSPLEREDIEKGGCFGNLLVIIGGIIIISSFIAGGNNLSRGVKVAPEGWMFLGAVMVIGVIINRLGSKLRKYHIRKERQIPNKEPPKNPKELLSKRTCPTCGICLPKQQVNTMIGNPSYQEWCREGFCSLKCFEQKGKPNQASEVSARKLA